MIKTACVTKKTMTLYKLRNFLRVQSGYYKAVLLFLTKNSITSFDFAKSGLT